MAEGRADGLAVVAADMVAETVGQAAVAAAAEDGQAQVRLHGPARVLRVGHQALDLRVGHQALDHRVGHQARVRPLGPAAVALRRAGQAAAV